MSFPSSIGGSKSSRKRPVRRISTDDLSSSLPTQAPADDQQQEDDHAVIFPLNKRPRRRQPSKGMTKPRKNDHPLIRRVSNISLQNASSSGMDEEGEETPMQQSNNLPTKAQKNSPNENRIVRPEDQGRKPTTADLFDYRPPLLNDGVFNQDHLIEMPRGSLCRARENAAAPPSSTTQPEPIILKPTLTKDEPRPINNTHVSDNRSFTSPKLPLWARLAGMMMFCASLRNLAVNHSRTRTTITPVIPNDEECLYVPGSGFSGFWFTLGRLQSLAEESSEISGENSTTSTRIPSKVYCYSAGCLATVAGFQQLPVTEVATMALGLQRDWNQGSLPRYDVVPSFVRNILPTRKSQTVGPIVLETPLYEDDLDGPEWLSRLHILTTVSKSSFTSVSGTNSWGLTTTVRTPRTIKELEQYLIETTWIPWITGGALFHDGHMDGAFNSRNHPSCETQVGLIDDWELYKHVLNMNLPQSHLEEFYERGVAFGI